MQQINPPGPVPNSLPIAGGQAPMMSTIVNQDQRGQNPNYQVKYVRVLSIVVIVLGCVCILCQIVDIFMRSNVSLAGTGIWGGIMFIIPGVVGILSVKRRSSELIIAFLVLSVIGAVVSCAPFIAGINGAVHGASREWRKYYFYGYPEYDSFGYNKKKPPSPYDHYYNISATMNAIMLIAAFVSLILLIFSAVYACHGLCSGRNRQQSLIIPGQVHYIDGANNQQQMVIVPMNQYMAAGSSFQASNVAPMPTALPGSHYVISNATTGGQMIYGQTATGQANTLTEPFQPPAYGHQLNPPQYDSKQPLPEVE